jgi:hypothetical protein
MPRNLALRAPPRVPSAQPKPAVPRASKKALPAIDSTPSSLVAALRARDESNSATVSPDCRRLKGHHVAARDRVAPRLLLME